MKGPDSNSEMPPEQREIRSILKKPNMGKHSGKKKGYHNNGGLAVIPEDNSERYSITQNAKNEKIVDQSQKMKYKKGKKKGSKIGLDDLGIARSVLLSSKDPQTQRALQKWKIYGTESGVGFSRADDQGHGFNQVFVSEGVNGLMMETPRLTNSKRGETSGVGHSLNEPPEFITLLMYLETTKKPISFRVGIREDSTYVSCVQYLLFVSHAPPNVKKPKVKRKKRKNPKFHPNKPNSHTVFDDDINADVSGKIFEPIKDGTNPEDDTSMYVILPQLPLEEWFYLTINLKSFVQYLNEDDQVHKYEETPKYILDSFRLKVPKNTKFSSVITHPQSIKASQAKKLKIIIISKPKVKPKIKVEKGNDYEDEKTPFFGAVKGGFGDETSKINNDDLDSLIDTFERDDSGDDRIKDQRGGTSPTKVDYETQQMILNWEVLQKTVDDDKVVVVDRRSAGEDNPGSNKLTSHKIKQRVKNQKKIVKKVDEGKEVSEERASRQVEVKQKLKMNQKSVLKKYDVNVDTDPHNPNLPGHLDKPPKPLHKIFRLNETGEEANDDQIALNDKDHKLYLISTGFQNRYKLKSTQQNGGMKSQLEQHRSSIDPELKPSDMEFNTPQLPPLKFVESKKGLKFPKLNKKPSPKKYMQVSQSMQKLHVKGLEPNPLPAPNVESSQEYGTIEDPPGDQVETLNPDDIDGTQKQDIYKPSGIGIGYNSVGSRSTQRSQQLNQILQQKTSRQGSEHSPYKKGTEGRNDNGPYNAYQIPSNKPKIGRKKVGDDVQRVSMMKDKLDEMKKKCHIGDIEHKYLVKLKNQQFSTKAVKPGFSTDQVSEVQNILTFDSESEEPTNRKLGKRDLAQSSFKKPSNLLNVIPTQGDERQSKSVIEVDQLESTQGSQGYDGAVAPVQVECTYEKDDGIAGGFRNRVYPISVLMAKEDGEGAGSGRVGSSGEDGGFNQYSQVDVGKGVGQRKKSDSRYESSMNDIDEQREHRERLITRPKRTLQISQSTQQLLKKPIKENPNFGARKSVDVPKEKSRQTQFAPAALTDPPYTHKHHLNIQQLKSRRRLFSDRSQSSANEKSAFDTDRPHQKRKLTKLNKQNLNLQSLPSLPPMDNSKFLPKFLQPVTETDKDKQNKMTKKLQKDAFEMQEINKVELMKETYSKVQTKLQDSFSPTRLQSIKESFASSKKGSTFGTIKSSSLKDPDSVPKNRFGIV